MRWKHNTWKYATLLVVMVVALNPEMIELALFIDAVGLEIFILLLEVQLIVALGLLANSKVVVAVLKLWRSMAKYSPIHAWKGIRGRPECLQLFVPGVVGLMHLLVISAAVVACINAW